MNLPLIQSPILRLVGQRLLKAIPLLLAIVICNFVLLKLAPGDAAGNPRVRSPISHC